MNIKPPIEELREKRSELKAKAEIDKFNLDTEMVGQIQLLIEVGEGYAYAIDNRDTAKHILDIKEATTAETIRLTNLEGKLSDAKVSGLVEKDSDYVQQKQFYIACKTEAELWSQLLDVFYKRQTVLRDLVTMHATGYYGSGLTSNDDKIEALKTAWHKKQPQNNGGPVLDDSK